MRILVTGACGFIGSNLTKRLLEMGHSIHGIDISENTTLLQELASNDCFTFAKVDVCEMTEPLEKFDQIFHLASWASPVDFPIKPVDILLSNIMGTHKLLGFACKMGSRFLFASSSEVYGDPAEHPQEETYWGNVNPNGSRSCYDEGKRAGEALVYAYQKQFKADVRVARIFNCYGPQMRVDDGRVVTNFIKSAILGEDILVHGDGTQTRCMQYVSDLVKGLIALMECAYSQGPINIGSTDEITMLDLAKTIKEITNSESEIQFIPSRPDDPKCRKPDNRLAKRVLNYEASIPLKDGLQMTKLWIEEQLKK